MALFIQVFVYTSLVLYALGAIVYFAGHRLGKNSTLKAASLLAIVGCISNLLALIGRTIISGRLPFVSGFEFILCFAFLTSLLYLIFEWRNKANGAGSVVMTISALMVCFVTITSLGQLGQVSQIMPALKSHWLTIHVITAALAYSIFALAAGLAAIQIMKMKKGSPVREDHISRIVAAGFVLLSFTIIIGAIWAEQAWGSYWSWDPKEVWALLTWIIYAVYLHLHRKQVWRGKRACWMVIAGFATVLFTFFGVNYLLSGNHSYAGIITNWNFLNTFY